ncbi:retrovirus-related pol polyprotein from transposon TNT 1-94 [Tanacetum coccineum]
MKGQFLKELWENTFSGSDNEDANEHIEKVLKIVDLFHVPNITVDQLMLRVFPISLTRAASHWLRNKPTGSIKIWEDLKTKFLNKYCPPGRTSKKMEEINNFQQEPDETLFQAWERFKELLMKCPQHYLTEMHLRERMELDLEARLMGETLVLNRSLDPFLEDYIELNNLNEPFELRRNQGDDLVPTIKEGEVIEEFRTRDEDLDTRIDDYPSYCDDDKKIHIDCAHNLKFSCMIGFEFTHINFFPLLYVNVMSKKFYNSIMKDKMVYKGDNVVGALMNVPIFVGTFSVVTDFAVLEDMDAYPDKGMGDVLVGDPFLREVGIKARRFDGTIIIYNGDDDVTYQIVRSHPRFKNHTNEKCNKIPPLLKLEDPYPLLSTIPISLAVRGGSEPSHGVDSRRYGGVCGGSLSLLNIDFVMSDSEDSTVTYTAVSSPFGGLSDIGSPGVDGSPVMPEDPYAYKFWNIIVNSSLNIASVNVHECEKCLKLETELLNKKDFVEKVIYDKLDNSVSNQTLKNDLRKLKRKDLADNAVTKHTIDPEMLKIDVEYLNPRLLNNRSVHSNYTKHTQEEATILREIVEQGKSQNPLNTSLDSACKYTKQIQELLVLIGQTCPRFNNSSEKLVAVTPKNKDKKVRFTEPVTSSGNTITKTTSTSNLVSNKLMLSSIGVKPSTSASGSQPSGNTKKEIRFSKHQRPTGRSFTTVGNACPSTRITTTTEVSLRKPTALENETPKPVVTLVYSRKPRKSKTNVPVSKSKVLKYVYANKKEPSKSWGSIVSDVPSSSLDECMSSKLFSVKFENDHMAKILGYGDYQIGNVTISRVYYVEGLRHNLFSVGLFCDSNLEVAFRQHTCFIHNLEGVDLLTGSRGNNLYTLSLGDMMASSPICLLSNASKTKSWLWHRRLSHLNFGAINHLARHGLVRGLPKLKFEKDHLCSACAMGKSKKKPHKPKSEDTNQEKLYLLHMDLCGPMRVASINGKKTYNGTEFVNQTLREYYEKIGISHETSVARSPQQNGVVERRNRTLIEAARTMLIYTKALLFLWAEAVATTCYTQNCSIIRLRHGKTPYELLHDKPPDLSFFHVFGALCYPTNDSENLDFDELTAMASEHSSSGPALHEMTLATISSGLVPNPPPSTSFVPPLRTDWDILFQPMFDELLTPPPSVDFPAPEVIAPINEVVAPVTVVSTGSPSSTTVDQDAPSPSNSQTTPETQHLTHSNDVLKKTIMIK